MATTKVRKIEGRFELNSLWLYLACLSLFVGYSTPSAVAIGNGTTVGKLRTNATCVFAIAGNTFTKASTDDLWDLTGPTDLIAAQYQAHWLYLDASGTASIGSGTVQASANDALGALPAPDTTKSIIGCYVAGPSTDYDAALAAQGTIYNGIPVGARLPGVGGTYVKPAVIELVNA